MDDRKVDGFCPQCGHGTLFLGEGGRVTCSWADCAAPEAADELLQGGEKYLIALKQINVIRSSIIARQTLNWSLHIYPLVQALGEAGFDVREDVVEKLKADDAPSGYEIERIALEAEGLFSGSLGSKRKGGSS